MEPQVFTAQKVARLLRLPEWRVVRFAQIKKYGIRPEFGEAEGSGSRRLYSLENVCEMALAVWLLEAGLRIEVIGRVLKQVRKQRRLSDLWEKDYSEIRDICLAIARAPKATKLKGPETVLFESWESLEKMFWQDSSASMLIIPVGVRFHLLSHMIIEEEGH
jgi:DNA-binding transcriptional MerR regulator